MVAKVKIHIQNLPEGHTVVSPAEGRIGQQSYQLGSTNVTIVGFFSTEHQGIFTHHNSFIHLHLITEEEQMMGHLDEVVIKDMTLYLPIS